MTVFYNGQILIVEVAPLVTYSVIKPIKYYGFKKPLIGRAN